MEKREETDVGDKTSKTTKYSVRLGRVGNRPLPRLWLSIVIRALQQLSAGFYLGTVFLQGGNNRQMLFCTVISGGFLLVAESLRHRQMYREVTGLMTCIKCVLLGWVAHGLMYSQWLLVAVFFFAAIVGHAPKNIRHRIFF